MNPDEHTTRTLLALARIIRAKLLLEERRKALILSLRKDSEP